MDCIRNKKGLYEYILTKSVMLAFILGLVTIFYAFYYQQMDISADRIAQAEADIIAKKVDDAIGFKGMSNTMTINLKRNLRVGNNQVPYAFNITKNGVILISYTQYPYQDTWASSFFGTDVEYRDGPGIGCTDMQLFDGAHFEVKKYNKNTYEPCRDTGGMCFVTTVTIDFDASESCYGTIHFEERYEKQVATTTP